VPLGKPAPALVIRYAYLWRREYLRGQEEGVKDRPCAVILTAQGEDGREVVTVLPITHSPPQHTADVIEIPTETKRRLGLDDLPSWIVLTEANRFTWPGPDLRPGVPGDPSGVAYGYLPAAFFERVKHAFLAKLREQPAALVPRTE
jgi:hypothetical protein